MWKDFWKRKWKELRDRAASRGYVCDACGAEVFEYPFRRLCDVCESEMWKNEQKICEKCGRKTVADGVCLTCKSGAPKFVKGFSPFVYKGKTAALVNRIKLGDRRLAYYFGEKMAELFFTRFEKIEEFRENGRGTRPLLILPVPMEKEKQKARGYNQAEDLAEIVCDRLQKAGVFAELDFDVMQKRKTSDEQKHLGFALREKNVSGAFHVHKRSACKDRVILLVDDIMTTGATGNECAARLYGAGAKSVYFLTSASLEETKNTQF